MVEYTEEQNKIIQLELKMKELEISYNKAIADLLKRHLSIVENMLDLTKDNENHSETKWQKVIKWCSGRSFTRKEFEAVFGRYPNTNSTYLTRLNRQGCVDKIGRCSFKGKIIPYTKSYESN